MRAPDLRISSIRSWWRGRSRTIVVMSFTLPPERLRDRLDVVADRAGEVDVAARARADGHLPHVHVGERRAAARGPTAIIDIAPLPPRATTPRPSSGSSARSTSLPPAPTIAPDVSCPIVERAEHDTAADGQDVERRRACRSPRPPRPRPGRPGRASGAERAPPARSRAGRPGTGRAASSSARRRRPRSPRDRATLLGGSRTSPIDIPPPSPASSFSITGTPSPCARRR